MFFLLYSNDTSNREMRGLRALVQSISTILKPIWTYGIQLWGMASTSNIEILECIASKVFRMIVDAPWYVPNTVIRRDLQTPTINEKSIITALSTVRASVYTQTI
jgi:hypothetical protein